MKTIQTKRNKPFNKRTIQALSETLENDVFQSVTQAVRKKKKFRVLTTGVKGGETLTTGWLLWKSSNRHIMGFLTSLTTIFGHVRSINGSIKFYESQPYMISHVTRTLKKKQKTQTSYIFPNKTNVNGLKYPNKNRGQGDGAVVRALASHQCGPGSISGLGVICGLSVLLVLVLAPRVFLRVLRFSSLLKN